MRSHPEHQLLSPRYCRKLASAAPKSEQKGILMRFPTGARILTAVALAAIGLLPLSAPASAGTPSTYTWTGIDAASSTSPNPSWSDGGNWAGGVAPPAGTPINLAFPASACTAGGGACVGLNDISGLVVDTITIGTPSSTSGNPPPGYSMNAATGAGITLDGGVILTGASSATATFSTDVFNLPITLGANNSWSLSGPSYLLLQGDLSGSAYSLHVAMSQGSQLDLAGTSNEVGAVTLTGASTSDTGQSSNQNGTLFVEHDLNGVDGNAVTASNVAAATPGATIGPLQITGSWLSVLSASQGPTGSTGVMATKGALSFDSSTLLQYQSLSAPSSPPTAGTDYPEITSTATGSLGNAQIQLMADCGMAYNTTFTLLSAASVSGNFDTYNGPGTAGPITNNEVIQAIPSSSCGTSAPPYLRINYTATAVTATVVPQPTSTTVLSTSPTSPQVNEPYQLVSTVTASPSGSAVPSGYVAFSAGGSPVKSCQSQPVQPVTSGGTTSYEAICDMAAPSTPASQSASATYSGSQILKGSTGSATVVVAKGTTSTSLAASNTNPYQNQQVTYTATVTPSSPSGASPSTPGGNVEFFDGTTAISGCTAQPLSGTTSPQATCKQTYASAGSHSIAAKYLGDGNFNTSTSNTQVVSVQAVATSHTAVSFTPTPTATAPVVGQSLAVTATVSSSGTPRGTVTFYADGGSNPISASCTKVTLSGSAPYTATCHTSFASAGSHSVSAVFTSSTSTVSGSNGSSSLAVQRAATSTSLGSSPASPTVGNSVTYTATVRVSSPGSGTPGGHVSFSDGGSVVSGCSSVALDAANPDTATCTVTYDSTGSHDVTATYAGNSNFTGSTSSAAPVTVGLPPGTTSSNAGTSTTPGGSATASNDQVTAKAAGGEGTVTVSQYPSDPVGAPSFQASGNYFDVSLSAKSTFTSVTVSNCNLAGGNTLYWWNPASGASGAWVPVKGAPGPTFTAGSPPCATVTLASSTSPSLSQMGGTVFTTGKPTSSSTPTNTNSPTSPNGYRMTASDGGVFSFNAPFYGSMGGKALNRPIVGISAYVKYSSAGKPVSCGYWLVASDGGVFSFNAPFHGSMGGKALNRPIVGMATDPKTGGYWLVASDGGVFSFNAPFYGSMGGKALNKPIVGMATTGE